MIVVKETVINSSKFLCILTNLTETYGHVKDKVHPLTVLRFLHIKP